MELDDQEGSEVFDEGDAFGEDTDSDPFRDSDNGSPGPSMDDFPSITLNNGEAVYCSEELISEFENYKKFFGDKAIFAAPNDPADDSIFVYLDFDLASAISPQTAMSWSIDSTQKYYIVLHFMADGFRNSTLVEPKSVEVVMGDTKTTKFTAHFQLKSITRTYVEKTWDPLSDPFESPINEATKRQDKRYRRFLCYKNSEEFEEEDSSLQETFSSLLEMGYEPRICYAAAKLSDGNLQTATALAIDCKDDLAVVRIDARELERMTKKGMSAIEKRKKKFSLFHRKSKEEPQPPSETTLSSSLSLSSGSITLDSNTYFIELALYIRSRLNSLNEYCILCDQKHLFGNMLKPTVCARDLCVWSFQELGIASDATDFVANSQEVVDLLLYLAKEAARSSRRELIFDPFPNIFDPSDPRHERKILDPKCKNYSLAQTELDKIPYVADIIKRNPAHPNIGEAWRIAGPICSPLASWVMSSNRSFFVKLTPEIEIKQIRAEQFLMLSAPPETENLFRSLRKQHGSVFAFHGSSIENWHSIIRNGLKNASGSKLQVNGAAYGSGIYMSPNLCVAMGYSRSSSCCVAVLEVINTPAIKKHGYDIWTLAEEKHVVTRMLLRYSHADTSTTVTGDTIAPQVRKALEYFKIPVD